eukprot:scaffold10442_cov106-Isochrysis_galbana.AAC.3
MIGAIGGGALGWGGRGKKNKTHFFCNLRRAFKICPRGEDPQTGRPTQVHANPGTPPPRRRAAVRSMRVWLLPVCLSKRAACPAARRSDDHAGRRHASVPLRRSDSNEQLGSAARLQAGGHLLGPWSAHIVSAVASGRLHHPARRALHRANHARPVCL